MNSFFTFFIATTVVSTMGMLFILLAKQGFARHISPRWQYNIGLLHLFLLAIPLIPSRLLAGLQTGLNIRRFSNNQRLQDAVTYTNPIASEGSGTYSYGWLQDFAVPIDRLATIEITSIAAAIWITGIIIAAAITYLCNRNLRLIKESANPIQNNEILALFLRCKDEVGVKNNIKLSSSILVKTPMTIGILKPQIILPATKMSNCDTRYAMLHELIHCKNKDIHINSLMCLFQLIYWFNPIVYLAFKQMRTDRELACDASVLAMLPDEGHISYGETLLNFAKSISRPLPNPIFAASMGGSKHQITKRIRHIASYTTVARPTLYKIKNICVFAVMFLLILCKIPIYAAFASPNDDIFHFQGDNVLFQDLSQFFGNLEGSFVLYDVNTNTYTIHNREMSITRVSPNSTYKIISALIALETGLLDPNNSIRHWDGTPHPFNQWNQGHDLLSAMNYSVSWYFQDIDTQIESKIGQNGLYNYLTRLSYGNRNLTNQTRDTDFWNESSLRISPVEQVAIMRNIYQNNTPFASQHVDTIKDVLTLTESDSTALTGKTGTGIINNRQTNGWFVGYVETGAHTLVFATYVQGEDSAGGSIAAEITLSILEGMGVFLE